MFKYRIFFEKGGVVDHIDLQGTTLEEVQMQAAYEVERRAPDEYWSQEIEAIAAALTI